MGNSFRLDRRGVGEILRNQCGDATMSMARKVADHVRADVGPDVEVTVESYTTDRAAAAVTIADPQGTKLQATRGSLTRAAAAVGLQVRSR